MDFTDFPTGADDEGRRLDKVIRIFIPDLPLSNIYQSMRKGLIKVNDKKSKPEYRINAGDVIKIADVLLKNSTETEPMPVGASCKIKIEDLIVFENPHILILNKPAGINVQKATKSDTSLVDFVKQYYEKTREKHSISFNPGALHRIDKQTSGLICFSMSLEGARWFTEQMKEHNIKKTYTATVEGTVTQSQTWKDYILKEDESGSDFHMVKVIDGNTSSVPPEAKESITKIIPIESFTKDGNTFTKCEFQIETGRQHQIRAQSAFHGHPLAGDLVYGAKVPNMKFDLFNKSLSFPANDLGIPKSVLCN